MMIWQIWKSVWRLVANGRMVQMADSSAGPDLRMWWNVKVATAIS